MIRIRKPQPREYVEFEDINELKKFMHSMPIEEQRQWLAYIPHKYIMQLVFGLEDES